MSSAPENTPSRFWSPIVGRLTPYVPGEQPKIPDLIKLNTNENPYPPSPRVLDAIQDELAENASRLRLYPDPNSDLLKQAVARRFGLQPGQVFVGNGSDEVLAHAFMGLLLHEAPLLFPDITYSFYPVYCGLYGIDYRTVPLKADFTLDPADYRQPCGGIIFPNPNAPTGIALPLQAIEQLASEHPDAVIVVDEAYVDFGTPSAIPLVNRFPNLLVIQTLSKSRSLAGSRIGFAVGHPDLIEALERIKNSFNSYPLDRLAVAAGTAAIEDEAYFQQTTQAIIRTREALHQGLARLGFDTLPSSANFVFTRHPGHDAAHLSQKLRNRSILVRHFRQPRIEQFLRITIGTDSQNRQLLAALAEIVN